MLKITIQDDEGAKVYFGTGVQIRQVKAKDIRWHECTIFINHEFVKSGSMLLHPTDSVFIEEAE